MSTKASCCESILTAIHGRRLGFEEIVENCRDCSRGSVNKYLRQLYDEKLVEQETGRGARKYFLSKEGEIYAGKLIFGRKADFVDSKSPQEIKKALEELKEIIELALKTPNSKLDAFFSCVTEIGETHTGFVEFKNHLSARNSRNSKAREGLG
jgi:DNA-binding transcriptional regulator GbsR (MarR family)